MTLVQGGVPEADTNGGGLTCEVAVDDGATLVAVDNAPAGRATGVCPDRFVLVPLGAFFPRADRNGNEFVCLKAVGEETSPKLVVIDDNANPHAAHSQPPPA